MPNPVVTHLDVYVSRQLLVALVAVTSALVALIWLTQSLRLIALVINHGLSLLVFLQLTGLLIPSFVAIILPITTFVVVQSVYNRMTGDRELTVMRASGMSPFELARPALAVTLITLVACYMLNLWVVPACSTAFRDYRFEIHNRVAAFLLQEGVFNQVPDDLTVYIRARDMDGTLRSVLIEDGRQKNSRATILAQRGRLIEGPQGPIVLLESGSREEVGRQTGRLKVLTFAQNSIDLAHSGKSGDMRTRDIDEMSLHELLHPEVSALNAQDSGKFLVEATWRLSVPLTVISFAMVAQVSVLMGTFQRHGNIVRPLLAIFGVVVLLALQLAVSNLAARTTALIPLIWLVAIGPAFGCAWALFSPHFLIRLPATLRRA